MTERLIKDILKLYQSLNCERGRLKYYRTLTKFNDSCTKSCLRSIYFSNFAKETTVHSTLSKVDTKKRIQGKVV